MQGSATTGPTVAIDALNMSDAARDLVEQLGPERARDLFAALVLQLTTSDEKAA